MGGIDIHASQLFAFAKELENLGVVGIFVIMLCIAIIANYFLFRHAMHNCDGLREIKDSFNDFYKELEKSNELQAQSLELIKEYSDQKAQLFTQTCNTNQSIKDALEKIISRIEMIAEKLHKK